MFGERVSERNMCLDHKTLHRYISCEYLIGTCKATNHGKRLEVSDLRRKCHQAMSMWCLFAIVLN